MIAGSPLTSCSATVLTALIDQIDFLAPLIFTIYYTLLQGKNSRICAYCVSVSREIGNELKDFASEHMPFLDADNAHKKSPTNLQVRLLSMNRVTRQTDPN